MTIDAHGNNHTPAGAHGAGQFAGKVNSGPTATLSEPAIAAMPVPDVQLDVSQLPDLPAYPEQLPPATVSIDIDNSVQLATTVWIHTADGSGEVEHSFTYWEDSFGDSYNTLSPLVGDTDETPPWEDGSVETMAVTDALLEWTRAVHSRGDILRYQATNTALTAQVNAAIHTLASGGSIANSPAAPAPEVRIDRDRIERAAALLNSPSRSKDAGELYEMLREIVGHSEGAR